MSDTRETKYIENLNNFKHLLKNNKVSLEDQKRNWATEGYAKFGAIIQQNNQLSD